MKVKDLIEKLKEFDEELEVAIYRVYRSSIDGDYFSDIEINVFCNSTIYKDDKKSGTLDYGTYFLALD